MHVGALHCLITSSRSLPPSHLGPSLGFHRTFILSVTLSLRHGRVYDGPLDKRTKCGSERGLWFTPDTLIASIHKSFWKDYLKRSVGHIPHLWVPFWTSGVTFNPDPYCNYAYVSSLGQKNILCRFMVSPQISVTPMHSLGFTSGPWATGVLGEINQAPPRPWIWKVACPSL